MYNYYNYFDAMYDDVMNAINDNEDIYKGLDRDTLENTLNDNLFDDDDVTGNGSGSYTFNSDLAEQYVIEDGQQYISDVIDDFCIPSSKISKHLFDYEYWDVSIRCYLLPQVINAVLDDLEDTDFFND